MTERPPASLAATEPERCADCRGALTLAEAVVYHGLIYHPACASGVHPPSPVSTQARATPERWPFGVPEFNCSGDL
ncbi:MAG TPA: hypothetical protein VFD32_23755 [Dehalococcoidia bacterium]|nr:hypothetical protein [Dehalococcoidia bacterium]